MRRPDQRQGAYCCRRAIRRARLCRPDQGVRSIPRLWLTRAVDLGIVGSALGQLFPIELAQFHKAGKLNAHTLLLAGMGEPGRFAQDSVRFIFSNIIVMIKTMGENEFASSLLGTRRNELPITRPFAALCRASATDTSVSRQSPSRSPKTRKSSEPCGAAAGGDARPAYAQELDLIRTELEGLVNDRSFVALKLTITRGEDVPPDPKRTSRTRSTSSLTYP